MLEALWSAEFKTSNGYTGAGIAVFETRRIFGGDSSYYYVGDYKVKDETLTASIKVIHYSGPLNNVFGPLKQVTLTVSGHIAHDSFIVSGSAAEAPDQTIVIRLTRRADLP